MHKKLQEKIDKALAVIKSQLKEKVGSEEISKEIYKEIVREFANIIHSEKDSKGYKYTLDALHRINELSDEIDNFDWHAALGTVALIADGRSPAIRDVVREEYKDYPLEIIMQFRAEEKEDLYQYLLGISE